MIEIEEVDLQIPGAHVHPPLVRTCIRSTITGDDYDICEMSSTGRWTDEKEPGEYNDGVVCTEDDPKRAQRWGILAEVGFAKRLGEDPDLSYREFGDNHDIDHNEKTYDIKTGEGKGLCNYARVFKYRKFTNDYYVASKIEDDRARKTAVITFYGYYTKDMVINSPTVKGKGNWGNKEIRFGLTLPIMDIV